MLPTGPPRASIGPWISAGVALVRAQLGPWVLLSFASLLPGLLLTGVVVALAAMVGAAVEPRLVEGPDAPLDPAAVEGTLAIAGPILLVGSLVAVLLTFWLTVGLYRAALRQVQGETPSLRHLTQDPEALPRALGAALLAGLAATLGTFLCIVPGLVAAGRLQFAVPLALDRGLSAGAALRASWEATRADSLGYTLHALVVGTLAGLGVYLCGVGMLFTWPLLFTATAAAYRDVFPRLPEAPVS